MTTAVTGHPPYMHDQILIVDVPVLNPERFCPTCGRALTPEEKAKYAASVAYCNECTWEMWANIRWE